MSDELLNAYKRLEAAEAEIRTLKAQNETLLMGPMVHELKAKLANAEEELKWRRGVHAVTGEVDRLKAELAASSERVLAAEARIKEVTDLWAKDNNALVDVMRQNARLREALEKIANDKWAMGTDMKGYDCSIAEVARGALSSQKCAPVAPEGARGGSGGATLNPPAQTHSESEPVLCFNHGIDLDKKDDPRCFVCLGQSEPDHAPGKCHSSSGYTNTQDGITRCPHGIPVSPRKESAK